MLAVLLATLVAFQTNSPDVPIDGEKSLSVCEILIPDPVRFNGKRLAVRGYLVGTDEGVWLRGDCGTHLVTKGLVWENELAISLNESDADAMKSWEQLQKRLKQLSANDKNARVWVTFVGQLETRATMDAAVVQMPYGLARAGFGHMGGSPAEIEVALVREIEVDRHPKRRK